MPMSREMKIGVWASVVASLIVIYALQPIVDFALFIIRHLADVTGRAFYDRIFLQAAMLEERNFGFYAFMAVGILSVNIAVFASVRFIRLAFKPESILAEKTSRKLSDRMRKILAVVFAVFVVVHCLTFAAVFAANDLQLQLITTFKQHIRILSPYLDEKTEELLVSKWSQMKGRADYIIIANELREIAARNGIVLPKNTLYTLDSL